MLGAQTRFRQRIDSIPVICAQIIPQRFTLMRKTTAHEFEQGRQIGRQFWPAVEQHGGGIHFGRRRERAGRHFADQFNLANSLRRDREVAVVARTRFGEQALGHLPLHQENGGGEAFVELQKAFDNRRCNVVGQVARDDGGSPLRQVSGQDIGVVNSEFGVAGKVGGKAIRQIAI